MDVSLFPHVQFIVSKQFRLMELQGEALRHSLEFVVVIHFQVQEAMIQYEK